MTRFRNTGFSYVEVLVAVVIVAATIGPGLDALRAGMLGTRMHLTLTEEQSHISSRLEEVLAMPFEALDTEAQAVADPSIPTIFSDAPGTDRRRLIYLARYDSDNADADGNRFTGGEAGLLWVRVELENRILAIETLTDG
jgi:type II secretory pathway pseudopilin PulG